MRTTISRLRLLVAAFDRRILTEDELFFRLADDVLTDLVDEAEKGDTPFEMAIAGVFEVQPPRAARIEITSGHIRVERCK